MMRVRILSLQSNQSWKIFPRTKPIIVSQPPVFTKKDVNSDLNGLSFTRVDNTKTRRPQPRSNTKHDRVPYASKSSRSKNKEAEIEEHYMNLLLSKHNKHMSSACTNIKLDSQDVISKVICAMCKQCLISVNHDVCLRNYVNGKKSRGKKQKANVSFKENQMKYQPKIKKPKKVGFLESLATPNRKPKFLLRWSPTGRLFDQKGNIVDSSESESQSDRSNGDNACTSNTIEPKIKRFPNSTSLLDRVVERRNRTLVEAAKTMLIFSRAPLVLWAEAIATACFTQNRSIIHRRFNKTPYELINGRKLDISFLHVFDALCHPKNDREDIGKLGAKGNIGFFIGYSADFCAYRIYNRRTKKIIETMNVLFDELSAMAFEQRSSKPKLQTMYDDYIGGQPSATVRTVPPAQEPQVRQTSTASTAIADTAPTPTNSSSHATNIPITSQDVDELNPNALFDGNTFVNPFVNSSTSAAESLYSQNSGTPVDATKYCSMIDALMYLMSSTPDIVHATCLCAQYQAKPTEKHLKEVKRIFCYLRGTVNTGLWYTKDSGFELTRFSDVDYAGCKDTFKSTSGGAQFLGEKLVSWSSKKQDCTALSTAEAKYVSLSSCCAQVLWMRTLVNGLWLSFQQNSNLL
nr:uncharacterized mitochondrial protein AtMg00810-like [Tanacetum cinerariifolium]